MCRAMELPKTCRAMKDVRPSDLNKAGNYTAETENVQVRAQVDAEQIISRHMILGSNATTHLSRLSKTRQQCFPLTEVIVTVT